ncbi:MAG: Bro-N domain-containing protein [Patescibacteria group bacterium]
MQINKLITVFEDQPVRRTWDQKEEKWYFSVVDIVAILTDSSDPRKYWNKLAERFRHEGSQLVTKCHQLKLIAKDGKKYLTDVADVETILRLVQSVPSPKAEPFKLWLAKVGYERMQETVDPELAVSRGRKNWQTMGRSQKWIEQRMLGVETRHKLTDYWADHGIKKGDEFAKLTNIIHEEWSGLSVKRHKSLKSLKSQNLRDHMSEAEMVFTALAELSTRQISEKEKAEGYGQNEVVARKGGRISGNARKALEEQTGKKVVNQENFLPIKRDSKKLGR